MPSSIAKEVQYLRSARDERHAGRADAAVAKLQEGLGDCGPSRRLLLALGEALEEAGRLQQAQTCYDRVIELYGAEPRDFIRAGLVRLRLQRPKDAEGEFQNALEADSTSWEARYLLAHTLGRQGRWGEALDLLESAAEIAPRIAAVAVARGDALRLLGRHDEAIGAYARAASLARDSDPTMLAEACLGRAQSLSATDATLEALHDTESAIKSGGLDPVRHLHARLLAAALALQMRDLNRVEEHAQVLIRADPMFAIHGWQLLLSVQFYRHDYPEQLKSLVKIVGFYETKAAELPEDVDLLETIGLLSAGVDRFDVADAALDRALRATGGRGRTNSWLYRTEVRLRRRDASTGEAASQHWWDALESARVAESMLRDELKEGTTSGALHSFGSLLIRLNRWEEGDRVLQEALAAGADQVEVESQRGFAAAAMGDHVVAIRRLRSVVAAEPGRLDERVTLALALFEIGALGSAEQELRLALDDAPGHLNAHIALADVLVRKAERSPGHPDADAYDEARRLLERALTLSSNTRAWVEGGCVDKHDRSLLGSGFLVGRALSDLHYSYGYVLVHAGDAAGGASRRRDEHRSLKAALRSFEDAVKADTTNRRAELATERVAARLREARTARVSSLVPTLLVAVALVLLVITQWTFWRAWKAPQMAPGYFVLITFGLLMIMVAAPYLPELLKLKVAGIELEKVEVAREVVRPLVLTSAPQARPVPPALTAYFPPPQRTTDPDYAVAGAEAVSRVSATGN